MFPARTLLMGIIVGLLLPPLFPKGTTALLMAIIGLLMFWGLSFGIKSITGLNRRWWLGLCLLLTAIALGQARKCQLQHPQHSELWFQFPHLMVVEGIMGSQTAWGKIIQGELPCKVALKFKTAQPYAIGDTLLFQAKKGSFHTENLPWSFDSGKFLKSQGIQHQLQVMHHCLFAKAQSQSLRTVLLGTMSKWPLRQAEQALAKALLLGDKSDLNREQRKAFAQAGLMHVLAVSGLHVGLIYLLLLKLMPRRKFPRISWFMLMILVGLFAWLNDFSASVSRAWCMLACVSLGQVLQRPYKPMNGVLLAAFILLWINPKVVLQLGFQLSFAAVICILLLYPRWEKRRLRLMAEKNWHWPPWLHSACQLLMVSCCAQWGTALLALMHFHQFPVHFLWSNLLVLPGMGLLMGLLLLAPFQMLFLAPAWSFIPLEMALKTLNLLVQQLGQLPGVSLGQGIYLSIEQCLVLLFIQLQLTWQFLRTKKGKSPSLLPFLAACAFMLLLKAQSLHQKGYILHSYAGQAWLYPENKSWCLRIYTSDTSQWKAFDYQLEQTAWTIEKELAQSELASQMEQWGIPYHQGLLQGDDLRNTMNQQDEEIFWIQEGARHTIPAWMPDSLRSRIQQSGPVKLN